LTSGGALTDVI